MFKLFSSAAVAAMFLTSGAQAATYSFDTNGPNTTSLTQGALTVTPGADGILNAIAQITQSTNGLGVRGGVLDTDPGNLDGFPLLSREFLKFTFAWSVKLVDFTVKSWDSNDDLQYSVNGGAWTKIGPGINGGTQKFAVNVNNVSSFRIAAVGEVQGCGFLCNIDGAGNDEFKVREINTAPVPLPAAGWMMVAGIAGLVGMKRRRKAA